MFGEKECLPLIRKFQTFSSIPKEIQDDKIYKFYVELEEQFFSLFSTEKTTDQQDKMAKTILSTFETIKEHKHFSQYFVELLVYYILIRPKQTEISCDLLSIILSHNSNQRFSIIKTIENDIFYQNNYFIQDILFSQGIIQKEPKYYVKRKDTVFSIYERGSLQFILKENNINSLKFIKKNVIIK